MKITIVQTEIETAIRNYIGEMFTIREGMQIDIDLSATRGPEGFIANINVVPRTGETDQTGGAVSTSTTTATTATSTSGPATTDKTDAPAARAPKTTTRVPKADPVVAASPEPAPETAPETAAAAEEQVVDQGQGQAEAQVETAAETGEATATVETAAPAGSAGKSLFGGLQRPQNS
jgi:hypothetical protein